MLPKHVPATSIAVVVIGRNEGERLRRCLNSVVGLAARVVYVDSGSTDSSVAIAHAMGADVLELNLDTPFTAARARNEGFQRLRTVSPESAYVQFVDGDCEIVAEWLGRAAAFLENHDDVAVVCGRVRERYPDRSIYNQLCDIEWDTAVGEASACGGNAMMRVMAFELVAGFRTSMIAGEEPELCVRLREKGWKIWRIDEEMTLHDAAMTRFAQWWKRAMRAGYAYAEGVQLHGGLPIRHHVPELRRALFWGAAFPMTIAALAVFSSAWLLLLLVYPLRIARLGLNNDRVTVRRARWTRALFLILGHFPEALGALKFKYNRCTRKQATLIEYK
jgi:GT2 family glycosyltransferase